jgi:uncharacterized protein YjbJ (UPF0337 family)
MGAMDDLKKKADEAAGPAGPKVGDKLDDATGKVSEEADRARGNFQELAEDTTEKLPD